MRNALIQICKTKQAKSRDRNRASNLKEFGVSQRGRGRRLLCHDMIVTVGCFRRHSSNPLDNLHRMFQDLIQHRCTRTKGINQQNLIEPKLQISRTKKFKYEMRVFQQKKKRNLCFISSSDQIKILTFLLITAPHGRILEIQGPYIDQNHQHRLIQTIHAAQFIQGKTVVSLGFKQRYIRECSRERNPSIHQTTPI